MKKKKLRRLIKNVFILSVIGGIFIAGVLVIWVSTFTIPNLDSFDERRVAESTKIYDRTGEILLYDVFQNVKRTVVPFDQISRNVKNATIAIEDAEFYEHHGIKPTAILRAVLVNIVTLGFSQGGSTITQQVVKNSLLTNEKSIARKLKEWVLAYRLEDVLSKDEILNMYLNEIPYGGSLYGVAEASQAFFGKEPLDLTLAESAYLAALPKAPTYYSPYGGHRDKLEERKNLVLKEMFNNNFISEEEYQSALKEEVTFSPQSDQGIKAPHFVIFVRAQLEKKYGEDVLESGGLKVITTLDYELQKKAEEIVERKALENKDKFNAENAAAVAVNPKTGDILTMVGSRNYFDEEIDGNFNVALAHRQPGSAFKPFAYATAFKKGYTPETVIFDLQTEFSVGCSPSGEPLYPSAVCYMPGNYDNIFRGPVTMREGLAQSINIPSIKTLYLAGMKDTLNLAKDMGIESLGSIGQYGLTLVLGGGEVSPLDLTSAYSVFANEGVRNPYRSILEIRDKNNNIIEKPDLHPRQVLSAEIAGKISDVLSDNVARTPAFGANSYLYLPGRDVAVKTGTTNDYRDAWIIGYTPSIALGAWAGNNDNSPMEKKVAGFIVAPMWNEIMNEILKTLPDEKFNRPARETSLDLKPVLRGIWQGGRSYKIDKISGKLATLDTPPETLGEIVVGGVHSILYWLDADNPRGASPQSPEADPQFIHWEIPVRDWVARQGVIETDETIVPTESDDVHRPEYAPKLDITNPQAGSIWGSSDRIVFSITNTGRYPLSKVEYFLNGRFLGASSASPFGYSFIPNETEGVKSQNTLKAVGYDNTFNKGEAETNFSVR